MKRIKNLVLDLLLVCSVNIYAQTAQKDSISTEIIETADGIAIKSTQVTSVPISSARIVEELNKFSDQEAKLEEQLKQIRAQKQEFQRLLGGVIVAEQRQKDRKDKEAKTTEAEKTKLNIDKKPKDENFKDKKVKND